MRIPFESSFALRAAASVLAALGALLFCVVLVPTSALALSEGRVYELVSPVYKNGYGIPNIEAVAPGGESVAFVSNGAFAGDPDNQPLANAYVARRGSAEWSTVPLNPPMALLPYSASADYTPSLEYSLSGGLPGVNEARAISVATEEQFLLRSTALPDLAANFEVVGTVTRANGKPVEAGGVLYEGASPDFSHIVFKSGTPPSNATKQGGAFLKVAVGTESDLYDLTTTRGVGGVPVLRLVGLNNKGKVLEPACQDKAGTGIGKGSAFNAVAADGEEIFFTLSGVTTAGAGEVCPTDEQLYVRVGGSRTLEVSRPLEVGKEFGGCVGKGGRGEVPCEGAETRAPAEFQGASEDGSKVFFTSAQPLVPGDTDTSNNLYVAGIGCSAAEPGCVAAKREVRSLVQVSRDPNVGEAAEVQGVVTVAADGSRVYFVARGALSTANGEGQAPVKGADNLYVYDSVSGGAPVFIGDLCSGPELSGVAEDVRCPSNVTPGDEPSDNGNDTYLWLSGNREHEVQTNRCGQVSSVCEPGRFLVFGTFARLTGDDTNDARDVYRYDAQSGMLARVSVGEDGYDANGNADACAGGPCDAAIADNKEEAEVYRQEDLESRAVSEDGSRVVFTTAAPLSQAASNGLANVYVWHEGSVSLISTGSANEPVEKAVISESGNDIFFVTNQGLVPQDTDGQSDVYDARVDGGFTVPAAEPEPCEGDACQGPLTNPAPLLVPGSVSQAPGGNFSAPSVPVAVVTPKKVAAKKCAKGKKLSDDKCVAAKTKAKKKTAKAKKSAHIDREGQS